MMVSHLKVSNDVGDALVLLGAATTGESHEFTVFLCGHKVPCGNGLVDDVIDRGRHVCLKSELKDGQLPIVM